MAVTDTGSPPPARGGRWRLVLFGILVLGLFVAGWFLPVGSWLDRFRAWVEGQGIWGAVVFGLVYVACTVLLVPGSVLTLAAGALFGPVYGLIVVSLAATTGAALAFLLGRTAARAPVQGWVRRHPSFAAVDAAVARKGGWIVFLLRLSPLFPFNLLNYALGLTGVRFPAYLLASWVGMLPGGLAYVLVGYAGRQTLTGGPKVVFWVSAALATLAVTFFLTRLATRAIRQATPPGSGTAAAPDLEVKHGSRP